MPHHLEHVVEVFVGEGLHEERSQVPLESEQDEGLHGIEAALARQLRHRPMGAGGGGGWEAEGGGRGDSPRGKTNGRWGAGGRAPPRGGSWAGGAGARSFGRPSGPGRARRCWWGGRCRSSRHSGRRSKGRRVS